MFLPFGLQNQPKHTACKLFINKSHVIWIIGCWKIAVKKSSICGEKQLHQKAKHIFPYLSNQHKNVDKWSKQVMVKPYKCVKSQGHMKNGLPCLFSYRWRRSSKWAWAYIWSCISLLSYQIWMPHLKYTVWDIAIIVQVENVKFEMKLWPWVKSMVIGLRKDYIDPQQT